LIEEDGKVQRQDNVRLLSFAADALPPPAAIGASPAA
jgi:hypothetical protein